MDPDMPFHHGLEVDSVVLERSAGPELTAIWTWVPEMFSEEDIRSMAEGWFHMLEALVQLSAQPGVGGLTPSDVPLVSLAQSEIDHLETEYGGIEDILPLSPVQEGMLFHAFYDAAGPDIYNVQIGLSLDGPVDEKSLQDAAKALLGRYPNLRSAFKHEGLARPAQIIPKDIALNWKAVDLSGFEGTERRRKLDEMVQQDRLIRFVPRVSPLFRFLFLRCGPEEFHLLITTHHILVDGWSVPLLIRELLQLYTQQGIAAALPRVSPFRDYLAWLAGRDRSAAEAAWREGMAGLEEGTRLSPRASLGEPKIPERIVLALDAELTRRLADQARAHSLTLNTVIQGAWAVLLSRMTGREDVVFGSTVSGRYPEVAGIETMVGLLINTVPTRVQLRPDDSLDSLIRRLNQEQSRLFAHQYVGLVEIQGWTGRKELFDTLVVFENFPRDLEAEKEVFSGVRLMDLNVNDAAHYPLVVMIGPGEQLAMNFDYHPDHFSAKVVERLSTGFLRLLTAYSDDPDQSISGIDLLDERERRQILAWSRTQTEDARNRTVTELFASYVAKDTAQDAVNVPLGKPSANIQVYVLDHTMKLVPIGIRGRLYIGGEGLAQSYWRGQQLTADKLVPDPFGQPGERLYWTGDIACWMEDGTLSLLGSADSQTQTGARKIEHDAAAALPQDQAETVSAVEALLIDIWAEMLGAIRVGVRDNFFDLGGHSLVALRIISRVNDHFQIEMSVRTLLEHPVLREFAQELLSISKRPEEEVQKIAKIGLMVRKMTPEQRRAALSVQ